MNTSGITNNETQHNAHKLVYGMSNLDVSGTLFSYLKIPRIPHCAETFAIKRNHGLL